MITATEIESVWSPAKRFTLVKPTFKGLEQSKIVEDQPGYLKRFGIYICMSDDGQIAIVGGNNTNNGGKLFHCFKKSGSTWIKYQAIMPDESLLAACTSATVGSVQKAGAVYSFA